MKFNRGAFFTERQDPDIDGFVVIESAKDVPGYSDTGPGYRIAEKYDGNWTTYWIPAETLAARIESGYCEYAKDVTESQFRGVLNLAGVAHQIDRIDSLKS